MLTENFPSVTIAIPVFNEENYIKETLLSAVNQSYPNLEIIISDNCSTDATLKIIDQIAQNYKNIIIVRQQKNIGAYENFMTLLEISNCDYFCWLGGHDLYHLDFISTAINEFQKFPELSLVYPRVEQIDKNGKLSNIKDYSEIDTTDLDKLSGPLKVVANLVYGTAIHGLFKTQVLKDYKPKNIIGGDFTIIFHSSFKGKIKELPDIYLFRREIRNETAEETYKRYKEIGIENKNENVYTDLCLEYLKYTALTNEITFIQRLKLLPKLAIILKKRYNSPYLGWLITMISFLKKIKQKLLVLRKGIRSIKIPDTIFMNGQLKPFFFVLRKNILNIKFKNIYKGNSYKGTDSISGPGSDLIQTDIIREEIPKIFEKFQIKSIIDAPCGDFHWMQHVNLNGIDYTGIDIVKQLIKNNEKKYGKPGRRFISGDIVTGRLPYADLILIRDCWVHLHNSDILLSVKNLKRSNIKYLLTTSFPNHSFNSDLNSIWRPLNLELAPFNFPKPLETINENCTEDGGIYSDKSLLLWEIKDLPDFR